MYNINECGVGTGRRKFVELKLGLCNAPGVAEKVINSVIANKPLPTFHDATTMSKDGSGVKGATPVLLLKTKSTPNDGYEEQFSTVRDGLIFEPTFVPVLEHRFLEEGLSIVRDQLQQRKIGKEPGAGYGGLIFTSQRAVEAFAKLVEEGKGTTSGFSQFRTL